MTTRKQSVLEEDTPIIEVPTMPGYVLAPNKSQQKRILAGEPLPLGIDVGYGASKVLAWGFGIILFKTIYGHERDLGYDESRILAQHPGEAITTDEGSWFIGDLAATQLTPREQLSLRGRNDANTVRRLMVLAALGKLFPGLHTDKAIRVILCTGLPVSHMAGAAKLKEELMGRWLVSTDQSRFPVEIEYVGVMPQPNGTISAYSLLPNGEENPHFVYNKIATVDNGKFSVDLSTEEGGLHIEAQSGTMETGLHTAFERMATRYNKEFGEIPDDRTVENIFLNGGKFKASGVDQDWSEEVKTDLKPMRDATISLCREKIGRAVQHELILNVGGPAPLVAEEIKREYRQGMMPANPQTLNALGYLHYSGFLAAELGVTQP